MWLPRRYVWNKKYSLYLTSICPMHRYEIYFDKCEFASIPNGCSWLKQSHSMKTITKQVTMSSTYFTLLYLSYSLEQQFATRLMERAWYENVWIGLNDLGRKGVYKWSDGSRVLWTNWYVGQPDERRTEKSCVFMSLMRGKRGWMYWRDQNCTDKYAFICKHRIGKSIFFWKLDI